VVYRGNNRIESLREQSGVRGYAIGFANAVQFILDKIPQNEEIREALRREVPMYPKLAVRELLANALVHQDLSMTGTGPMVEIFSDRLEITNPGIPLIDTERFLDLPPLSRNETLTHFMRRLNICEERGSGIDKVIFEIEFNQLPPPEFSVTDSHTKVALFAFRTLSEMESHERIRACYQHACLRYVSGSKMTNESLRRRLAIEDQNYSMASRIISDAIDVNLIKPFSKTTSRRYAKYVPFWA